MRDAEANNYYNDRDRTGWELRAFDTDNFKAGWDARDKIDNEALKIAVEKLEEIAEFDQVYRGMKMDTTGTHIIGRKSFEHKPNRRLIAAQALTKIRELMGEK